MFVLTYILKKEKLPKDSWLPIGRGREQWEESIDLEARLLNVLCFIVLHWNHENVFQNYRRKLIQKGKREEPNVDAERWIPLSQHAINVILSMLRKYTESNESQLSFYKYAYSISKCPKIHITFSFFFLILNKNKINPM